MNRHGAYHRFFTSPVVGALSHAIGQSARFVKCPMKRDRSLQELPDHVLKDIGISRSEILSLSRFRGSNSTRMRRR